MTLIKLFWYRALSSTASPFSICRHRSPFVIRPSTRLSSYQQLHRPIAVKIDWWHNLLPPVMTVTEQDVSLTDRHAIYAYVWDQLWSVSFVYRVSFTDDTRWIQHTDTNLVANPWLNLLTLFILILIVESVQHSYHGVTLKVDYKCQFFFPRLLRIGHHDWWNLLDTYACMQHDRTLPPLTVPSFWYHPSSGASLTLSNHLLSGLPNFLGLLPITSIPITLLPTEGSSLRIKGPYHFNLLYWTFCRWHFPCIRCLLNLSFLIVSNLVNPHPPYVAFAFLRPPITFHINLISWTIFETPATYVIHPIISSTVV